MDLLAIFAIGLIGIILCRFVLVDLVETFTACSFRKRVAEGLEFSSCLSWS